MKSPRRQGTAIKEEFLLCSADPWKISFASFICWKHSTAQKSFVQNHTVYSALWCYSSVISQGYNQDSIYNQDSPRGSLTSPVFWVQSKLYLSFSHMWIKLLIYCSDWEINCSIELIGILEMLKSGYSQPVIIHMEETSQSYQYYWIS